MPGLVPGAHSQVRVGSRFGSSSVSSTIPASPTLSIRSLSPSSNGIHVRSPSAVRPTLSSTNIYGSPESATSSLSDVASSPSLSSDDSDSELDQVFDSDSEDEDDLSSPPTSLDTTSSSLPHRFASLSALASAGQAKSSATLLNKIFPRSSSVHSLSVTSAKMDDVLHSMKGAILEDSTLGLRTLFISGANYEEVNMRETICGVLEKAEDEFDCTGVVMCIEKDTPELGDLLHSLMYVGGTVSTIYDPNPQYILIGLDL